MLKTLEQLSVNDVYVDSEGAPSRGSDPNAGKKGYYAVPAVSLLAKCDESYDPEGILVWLPDYYAYGTWDSDHWDLLTFPDVAWADIIANPLPYLNAQWEQGVNLEHLAAWERFPFRKGRPF